MLPERRAAQQLMGVAVEFAAEFNPTEPGWAIAAQLVLGEDWSRDVLIAQMVRESSYEAAVAALGTLPRDGRMNRDAAIATALWLGGHAEQALVVAGLARMNRLAGLVELLITVSADPDEWGRRLVESLTEVRPNPVGLVALKPR